MNPKTRQRAMELCELIESELRTVSSCSDTRPPELARVVECLDELRELVEAPDRPPAGDEVSHIGSAVWRVVVQVSLELIKALADSQKYMQPVQRTVRIDHAAANARYGPQATPWGERAFAKEARSPARSGSHLCVTPRKWSSRAVRPSSSAVGNASRCPTWALARPRPLVRHA